MNKLFLFFGYLLLIPLLYASSKLPKIKNFKNPTILSCEPLVDAVFQKKRLINIKDVSALPLYYKYKLEKVDSLHRLGSDLHKFFKKFKKRHPMQAMITFGNGFNTTTSNLLLNKYIILLLRKDNIIAFHLKETKYKVSVISHHNAPK